MSSAQAEEVTSKVAQLEVGDNISDLRSKWVGIVDDRFSKEVVHFRGIPYATIAQRFAKPEIKKLSSKVTDYTQFGPQCPQIPFETRTFLLIPKSVRGDRPPKYDELKCTNLNITCPTSTKATKLPVLMWLYGGSMMNAYGNAEQRLGDTGPIVAQSIELGKPIILVTVNFRLNIFHFGNGEGNVNLAIEDQKAALKWVRKNISKFGGDPDNVTVGGESAGASCAHALLASVGASDIARVILQSGTLYSSVPQPDKDGFGLVGLIEGNLQLMEFDKGNTSGQFGSEAFLSGADPQSLLQTLQDLQITRFWLWDEPYLKDRLDDKKIFGELKGVLIGDTKDEFILWWFAFKKMNAKSILSCFETKTGGPEAGKKLTKAYGIDGLEEDHEAVRKAAMHFMADARFALWPHEIVKNVNAAGGKAYQYYYDEPNPFHPKEIAMAGHAVDLFALFGGYDDDVNDETRRVGRMLRTKWIDFVNGEEPWATDEVFVFGPKGMTGAINRDSASAVHDLNPRRRQAQLAVIKEVGLKVAMEAWQNLTSAAKRSS